jgi:F-type H+-transporting ATPase subunit gamma
VPNLKDIQRRIGSVKKTQQITRAMRMVAGAKLRRAQDAITQARPYAERMRETVVAVAAAPPDAEHPLLQARESVTNLEVIIVSSDRGLCGAFNSSLLKHANRLLTQRDANVSGVRVVTAGRKARDFFKRRRPKQMAENFPQDGWVTYGAAVDIANGVASRYIEGEIDEAILVYSEFVSPMTQRPRDVRVLPFAVEAEGGEEIESLPYEIEPDPAKLLATLIPKALETEIFRALLENQAGEHAARMAAMESATRNTEELIDRLTLQYNRARQAAITKELVEIVSGAEAL